MVCPLPSPDSRSRVHAWPHPPIPPSASIFAFSTRSTPPPATTPRWEAHAGAALGGPIGRRRDGVRIRTPSHHPAHVRRLLCATKWTHVSPLGTGASQDDGALRRPDEMAGTSRLTKWQSHAVAALGVVGICRRRDGVRIRTPFHHPAHDAPLALRDKVDSRESARNRGEPRRGAVRRPDEMAGTSRLTKWQS